MLLIRGDVETLDHRCAHWAELIHDDRVPLLPTRGEPGPCRSLTVSDLIGARHRPSPHRCIDRTRRRSFEGVHDARSALALPSARLRPFVPPSSRIVLTRPLTRADGKRCPCFGEFR